MPPKTNAAWGPIWIAPQSRLAEAMAQSGLACVLGMTSDEAPDLGSIRYHARQHLRFNDISSARDGLVHPSDDHVRQIIAFGRQAGSRPVIAHCYAGISRSTAAAYIIACDRAGPGREEALAERLRARSPSATPNPLLIEIADRQLQRGGAMVSAIRAIGRGADAYEGGIVAYA